MNAVKFGLVRAQDCGLPTSQQRQSGHDAGYDLGIWQRIGGTL